MVVSVQVNLILIKFAVHPTEKISDLDKSREQIIGDHKCNDPFFRSLRFNCFPCKKIESCIIGIAVVKNNF